MRLQIFLVLIELSKALATFVKEIDRCTMHNYG